MPPPVRTLILGNLDNRRVRDYALALAARGHPPAILRAHADLLADPRALLELDPGPLWVRIESLGEDPALERALLERGWGALEVDTDEPAAASCERISPAQLRRTPPSYGQILAPRQYHCGFLAYLAALEAVLAERPRWRVLSPIADIRVLFDKRQTSARYAAAGVPVPEALAPGTITRPEQLRAAMVERRWPTVFVKLSCASSASCLALYRYLPHRPPAQRELLVTTVATTEHGRFNSLRLQRLEQRERIDPLLDWLLAEGVQIERSVPKARASARYFDLRVLVIAGEVGFCVMRQSRHPITNLHLGGQRGDLSTLRAHVEPEAWAAAMRSCERVFASHGCHHLGIDLMFEPDLRRHHVIEANAFGDLLPRLEREGLNVYEWEIETLPPLGEG